MKSKYVTAAFLGSGFIEHPEASAILEHWDAGHLELVCELTGYTDYIHAMFDAGLAVTGSVPGVFDYEVTEAVAYEFGSRVLLCAPGGDTPDAIEMCAFIRNATHDFYMKAWGVSDREDVGLAELFDALAAVPMYAEAC